MSPSDRSVRGRYLVGAAVLGLLLSQLGHSISYVGQFGLGGLSVESTGVHSYYPGVVSSAAALIGAIALGVLLVLGLARTVRGRGRGGSVRPVAHFIDFLGVLVAVQMAVYTAQELAEATASGRPLTALLIVNILSWGVIGQSGPAIIAALALSWCSVRLQAALVVLRRWLAIRIGEPRSVARPDAIPSWAPLLALEASCPRALFKRGPPKNILLTVPI